MKLNITTEQRMILKKTIPHWLNKFSRAKSAASTHENSSIVFDAASNKKVLLDICRVESCVLGELHGFTRKYADSHKVVDGKVITSTGSCSICNDLCMGDVMDWDDAIMCKGLRRIAAHVKKSHQDLLN